MSGDEGFASLRLNRQEGQTQEGFWPSFTNIMTVIVMIFLIALVILLLRNLELVDQLRTTMEAERAAAELARTTGEEKEVLAVKLNELEAELTTLRLQKMRADDERKQQEVVASSQTGQIKDQQQQLEQLTGERDLLKIRQQQAQAESERLQSDLKAERERIAQLEKSEAGLQRSNKQQGKELDAVKTKGESLHKKLAKAEESRDRMARELAESRKSHEATLKGLASLEKSHKKQSEELATFRDKASQAGRDLSALRDEHDQLKTKHDQLIKPVRSPLGKQVIEVRYSKVEGEHRIEYRETSDGEFKQVSREELENHLMVLKADQPNGLFIKVTLPENSGLSYNEAWTFTSELHKRYDYYFQTGRKPVSRSKAVQDKK